MPTISVVINTFDGIDVLPRAVRSVLSQGTEGLDVVVADDGSADSPQAMLANTFPGADLRLVTQANAGLSAARNLGARTATGDYVVFLDDDDELLPGALEALGSLLGPDVGIASGGVEVVEVGVEGPPHRRSPTDLGPEMDHERASYLAGSFAISRRLLLEMGGFDEALRCNHQRELFLRAVPWCRSQGHTIVSTSSLVLRMYRRPPGERARNEPARLQGCLERILDRHRGRLARNPSELASLLSNAGVAAARNRDYRAARAHLRQSVRVRPSDLRNLARFIVACVPVLARRVWAPP